MIVESSKTRVRSCFTPSKSTTNDRTRSKLDHLDDEIWKALRATGYFINRHNRITVDVSADGHVLLRGTVPSYYHKQRAQVAAMSVTGVRSLQNDLVVKSTEKTSHLEETDYDHII